MDWIIYIVIILVALGLSAFFSGVEVAFFSANKLKLEILKDQHPKAGKILSFFQQHYDEFIGLILVGNNVALILFTLFLSALIEPFLLGLFGQFLSVTQADLAVMLIQTLFATSVVLVFSEYLPKATFRNNSSKNLIRYAKILRFFYWIFWIPVRLVLIVTRALLSLIFNIKTQKDDSIFTKVDLEHYFDKFVISDKEVEQEELNAEIFERALALSEVKARECMIPRTEIVALEDTSTIEELTALFVSSKHSKIIIYKENIDDVIGYVHHFDLLNNPKKIKDILFPVKVVPESMDADELLNLFILNQKSLFWVVDEFGGTAGIVTLEDVLEEIFGEIRDEYDDEGFVEREINPREYEFSARLEIDYLNEKYEFNLPEGDYETLGGLLTAELERIPDKGEVFTLGNFEFKIDDASENRIETLRLLIRPDNE